MCRNTLTEGLEDSPSMSIVKDRPDKCPSRTKRNFEDYVWPGTVWEWEVGAILVRERL